MTDIYLDHNSTAPIDPEVAEAISACYAEQFVNPASQHRLGQRARKKLELTKRRITSILGGNITGMQTDDLVLTSGGTESNNLALLGLAANEPGGRVLVSAIEHPSVIGAAEQLARLGYTVEQIPVDQTGVCRLDAFAELIEQPTCLVSLMLANNETGVLQPVGEVAKLCRAKNILCHTDAVQAVGKLPVSFQQLAVDAMTFTAHKFHGPRGVGGLMLRHGTPIQPILYGGFQQMAIRPGTEDIALTVGLLKALELFDSNPQARFSYLQELRDRLQDALVAEFDDLVVNGGQVARTPQTLNVSFPGVDRQSFLLAADMAGLAVSTGSACASGSSDPSPVLMAMGLARDVVEGSVRISLGATTTADEIDEAIARIKRIIVGFRSRK